MMQPLSLQNWPAGATVLQLVARALFAFLLLAARCTAAAEDSDIIFDYAESAYPQFVAPAGAQSHTSGIYYYRYYPGTRSYVATANGHVYYMGPSTSNRIVDLGLVSKWLSDSLGILAGAVVYQGPTPSLADVTYTDTDNQTVTLRAVAGQVIVYFNVDGEGTGAAALAQREAAIQRSGGTPIQQIPLLGFYLARVTAGQENNFIRTVRNSGLDVSLAMPNAVQTVKASTPVTINDDCWLGIGDCKVTKYIPLNVPAGLIVLDEGEHGEVVQQRADSAGGEVTARVGMWLTKIDGKRVVTNANAAGSMVAIMQGAAMFAPGKPVIVNYSYGPSADCENDKTIACGADPLYAAGWEKQARFFDETINATLNQLPATQRDKFLLVHALGNAAQDITDAFGRVNAAALASGASRNHLFVGASDYDSDSTYVDQSQSRNIAWYPGCIAPKVCGTSYAAPVIAAIIDRVVRRTHTSLHQARTSVLEALASFNYLATPSEIVDAAAALVASSKVEAAVAITSSSCTVTRRASNTTDIKWVTFKASGIAAGGVGVGIPDAAECPGWGDCWRDPGEPESTTWSVTYPDLISQGTLVPQLPSVFRIPLYAQQPDSMPIEVASSSVTTSCPAN